MECVVVGVDGGASRSSFIAFDASRLSWSRWSGSALSLFYRGASSLAGEVRRGVWASLRLLGARGVRGVYAGVAGLDAGVASVRKARAVESLTPFPLILDHDAYIAWWTSWIEGGEAAVIAGTGSLVYLYDPESGERRILGDHGPLLGDQGSAFEVGSRALRMLGEALQGLRRWTCLEEALASRLGVSSPEEASAWVHLSGRSLVGAAAGAARVVVDAAEEGCGEAASLLRRAALGLARLVSTAAGRWGVRVFRVYGGLARSSVYMEALESSVEGAVVSRGILDPAVGAVWLALQHYCDNLTVSPGELAGLLSDLDAQPV